MKLSNVKNTLSVLKGRSLLKVKKNSPEILMVVGGISIIGGVVMTAKATLKVESIVDEAAERKEKIESAKANYDLEKYSEHDYKKDLTIVTVQTGVKLAKEYLPAIFLTTFGISCMIGAHRILKKRNVLLMGAYKTLDEAFSKYRDRVKTKFGDQVEYDLFHNIENEKHMVTSIDADGNEVTEEKEVRVIKSKPSMYAKFFDESNVNWSKTPEYNLMFLRRQQAFFTDLLRARGHVFLNEVYEGLDIPHTQQGALVGWVSGNGDDYVDFGLYNQDSEPGRDFINGFERSVILDFNVDGVIYDLI